MVTDGHKESPLIAEGLSGSIGQGIIGVYDVVERRFRVLESDARRNFIPIAMSTSGRYVLYEVEHLADCFWDWPSDTWCSNQDEGSIYHEAYVLADLIQDESMRSPTMDAISERLRRLLLNDYIVYRHGASILLNGKSIFTLNIDSTKGHVFNFDRRGVYVFGTAEINAEITE